MTDFETAGLFIPVLSTSNREDSLAFYQALNNADQGLCFNTKITVLNRAWQKPIDHQYAVATLQLDGKCLFEIDEVSQANAIETNPDSLPSGIAMITCMTSAIDKIANEFNGEIKQLDNDYYHPFTRILMLKGPTGELIELVSE